MESLFTFSNAISLFTLTMMEVILGIDNIVFISIVASRLPHEKQNRTRLTGLSLALLVRVGLLFTITWILGLKSALFSVYGSPVSLRDIILLAGGIFLMGKSTSEIHDRLEGEIEHTAKKKAISVKAAVFQIVLLDVVFSFDSILTAVGISKEIVIMILAVVLSMIVMMVFAKKVADFINKHPSVKMLALSFLLMIGLLLVIDGLPDILQQHVEVPRGYLYFAMAFSLGVELLNIRVRKKSRPVKLHDTYHPDYIVEDKKKPQ